MNNFQSVNNQCLQDLLSKLNFKKKGTYWFIQHSNETVFEFRVRFDKWGWQEGAGSSFVYELTCEHNGQILYELGQQYRLFELSSYDSSLPDKAVVVLDKFSKKIDIQSQDLQAYTSTLIGPWTAEKVKEIDAQWYLFYDEEDLKEWHRVLEPALKDALQNRIENLAGCDFLHIQLAEKKRKSQLGYVEKVMKVNFETGELIETDEKFKKF